MADKFAKIDALLKKGSISEATANAARESAQRAHNAQVRGDKMRQANERQGRIVDYDPIKTRVRPGREMTGKADVEAAKAYRKARQDREGRFRTDETGIRMAMGREGAKSAPEAGPEAPNRVAEAESTKVQPSDVRRARIRDKLLESGAGVAAMEPTKILEGIDRRREAREFPRDYEVITETGGQYPGQVVERGGRQYYAPGYGPVAGELIEILPGRGLSEIQEFAAGPPGVAAPPPALPQTFAPSQIAAAPMPPTFAPSGPAAAAPMQVAGMPQTFAPSGPAAAAPVISPQQQALAMQLARQRQGGG